jgi:S1-C subfamily serine protease
MLKRLVFLLLLFCFIASCLQSKKINTAISDVAPNSSAEQKNTSDLMVCSITLVDLYKGTQILPQFTSEGKHFGYMIADIKPGHLFKKIGLVKNDIILAINDIPADSAQAIFKGFTSLKPGPIHSFVFRRSDKVITIQKPCPN